MEIPTYDFVAHQRDKETTKVVSADIILLEGILIFHRPELTDLMDLRLYVDTDADIRLARRSECTFHTLSVKKIIPDILKNEKK